MTNNINNAVPWKALLLLLASISLTPLTQFLSLTPLLLVQAQDAGDAAQGTDDAADDTTDDAADATTDATICVCSPTVFNFVLSLSQSCDDNDIEGNVGIDGAFCFVDLDISEDDLPTPSDGYDVYDDVDGESVDDDALAADGDDAPAAGDDAVAGEDVEDTEDTEDGDDAAVDEDEAGYVYGAVFRRRRDRLPELIRRRRHNRRGRRNHRGRRTRTSNGNGNGDRTRRQRHRRNQDTEEEADAESKIPVEIISVQFLEFDTLGDLNVIYQDDTYSNVSLTDGDTLTFYSKSSFLNTETPLEDQMDYVPGGASLILYGKTEDGDLVRNRFFWIYTNGCEDDSAPVEPSDKIGWVQVGRDLVGPWPAFCAATPPDAPTISPRTMEPTFAPSRQPTDPPSASPAVVSSTMPTDVTNPPVYGPVVPSPTPPTTEQTDDGYPPSEPTPSEPTEPSTPTSPSEPMEPTSPSSPTPPSYPTTPTAPTPPHWWPTGPTSPTSPTYPMYSSKGGKGPKSSKSAKSGKSSKSGGDGGYHWHPVHPAHPEEPLDRPEWHPPVEEPLHSEDDGQHEGSGGGGGYGGEDGTSEDTPEDTPEDAMPEDAQGSYGRLLWALNHMGEFGV